MLINAPGELQNKSKHRVCGYIAGAAPPASTIEGAEVWRLEVTAGAASTLALAEALF